MPGDPALLCSCRLGRCLKFFHLWIPHLPPQWLTLTLLDSEIASIFWLVVYVFLSLLALAGPACSFCWGLFKPQITLWDGGCCHPTLLCLSLIGPTPVHKDHSFFVQTDSGGGPNSLILLLLSYASSSSFLSFRISRGESDTSAVSSSKCLRHIRLFKWSHQNLFL